MPEPKTVEQLIQEHRIPTVPAPQKPEQQAQGGMFLGQDGRRYYRYQLNGETVILPKPIEEMREQDYYDLPIAIADAMSGRLPQNLTVKFKDPQWAGYWFNKKAGGGARIATARSLGFIPALLDDVEAIEAGLEDGNGAVEQHDLVLMKIHKHRLFSKYKSWIDMARMKGGIDQYRNNADAYVRGQGGDMSKGSFYLTPQAKEEFQGVGPVVNLPVVANQ